MMCREILSPIHEGLAIPSGLDASSVYTFSCQELTELDRLMVNMLRRLFAPVQNHQNGFFEGQLSQLPLQSHSS